MPANDLEIYESWNLDLPLLPNRSRLYHLKPIAIGDAYVEGLISYVCRLAEAHCVSPGVLTKQEILPSLRKVYNVGSREVHEVRRDESLVSISSFPKPESNKNPNEPGFWAWQYIEGLQPLTLRENLEALTIPNWKKQIPQVTGIEVARELRAWCPECFQQWRKTNQIIYEPMLWSIALVTVCPYHYLPLQTRCPYCKKTQRPITGKMQVARCSECLEWLGIQPSEDSELEIKIKSEVEWHHWVAEKVMEILVFKDYTLTANAITIAAPITKEKYFQLESSLINCPIKYAQQQFLKLFFN
uniref:TniQ domain-containing protein n=1 Tax=Cyanothece sp. (strain PCC 7425 / ATCC 29141) TaxID=395961 RepID=B8HXB8_CYAP4